MCMGVCVHMCMHVFFKYLSYFILVLSKRLPLFFWVFQVYSHINNNSFATPSYDP